jgi:Pro-kumamolisin, activation domain/Divergent InlB B-repeat domain
MKFDCSRWICAALLFLSAGFAPAAQTVLSGHVPAAVAHLNAISAVPATTRLNLAIGLPLRNPAAMERLLQQISDPASPNYRHYLTPEQFTEQFGPSQDDYERVLNFARTNGLTVTATYSNRTVLNVSGAVSDIEKAFHVTMQVYQHPTESRTFYSPNVEPTVNASVPILSVQGMNNYILPHPMYHIIPASNVQPEGGSAPNNGGFMGQDFRNAYLPGVTLKGTGQTVGLLQFDGFISSDIRTYENLAGLPNVPLITELLDGVDGSAGEANVEVCLDIETSISMAPSLSAVFVFEGEFPDSILSAMVSSGIKQLSSSWGYQQDATTEQFYKQMILQGQTFLTASGDGDAWVNIIHPVSFPNLESTNITLVGGTTLTMSGKGVAYVSETAWNSGSVGDFGHNPDGFAGTAGGISTDLGIPSWQQGISMTANLGSTTNRNMPDVALTADNVFVVANGGQQLTVGGTSCASPLWAGFMALVSQQAATAGNPSVGFLAPEVYALAKTASYTNYFHDTITGNNFWDQSPTNFPAVAGYDLCTGLGTPNGKALIFQLAGRSPRTGFMHLTVDPPSGSTLLNSTTQTVFVTINDGGFDVTNATVTAVIPGVTNLTLLDNGQAPDAFADDGVYSATFQVPAAVSSLTMTVTANATNVVGATNVIYYSAVTVLNDNFANATKVPVAGAAYFSNNKFATLEVGEPAHNGDTNDAASLWWSWTPSTSTNVFIDTIGSQIDTVLAVYTGSTLVTLQPVAAASGSVSQSQSAFVSFNAQAGVPYRIAVASVKSNSVGSLVLHVTPGGQLDSVAPVVSVTSPLSGQSVTTHSILLSGTAFDPTPNASGVSQVFVTGGNGIGTVATGTTNWTAAIFLQPELNIISVYAEDAAGNFSSPVTVEVNYLPPTEANDFFVSATNFQLTGTSGVVSGGNTNATKENGEPIIAGNAGGKSVWWSFTAPADGVLTLNTTNSTFDTLLGLYTGTNVAALTLIADNDDAFPGAPGGFSFISQAVKAGQTYDIDVDGYDAASGNISLSYSFSPATVYHLVANAVNGGTVQLMVTNILGGTTMLPGQSGNFAAGSAVILSAIPFATAQFNNWSGDVSSSVNPLTAVVQNNVNLTANFVPFPFTDGFESGNLSHLPWTTAGNAPWFVQTNIVDQGMYAAQSGAITNSQTSSLILTTNFNAGLGSFDFKVSSEADWDFLNFSVDGVLYKQWSGEIDWANYTFALNAGMHTLEWSYTKDPSLSSGLDAAFIDDVNLPLGTPIVPPPQLKLQRQSDGSLVMTVTGQGNGQYITQTSTNLVNWQNFSTNTASGGVIQIIIPANPTNRAQFYRAFAP